jgi:NADPH-dependent glutamate synthase beta subunit-like oxidoreductase
MEHNNHVKKKEKEANIRTIEKVEIAKAWRKGWGGK